MVLLQLDSSVLPVPVSINNGTSTGNEHIGPSTISDEGVLLFRASLT